MLYELHYIQTKRKIKSKNKNVHRSHSHEPEGPYHKKQLLVNRYNFISYLDFQDKCITDFECKLRDLTVNFEKSFLWFLISVLYDFASSNIRDITERKDIKKQQKERIVRWLRVNVRYRKLSEAMRKLAYLNKRYGECNHLSRRCSCKNVYKIFVCDRSFILQNHFYVNACNKFVATKLQVCVRSFS